MVFEIFGSWLVVLLLTVAVNIVAYMLMPKPKRDKPPAADDLNNPTAEAGRPIIVIFGSPPPIKSVNILGFWDKSKNEREIDA